ncbi:MAG: SUF system NifU family Fe-S cluster assembly protein [Rhodospirillales bacterium]|nr:SUF system NifU family Fe-S cluster assembly protein [Rhodospirillales bacterium]
MSSELRELYQEVILDHGRTPRNFHKPEGANHHANGHNPLCGDRVTVHLKLKDDKVEDVGFEGSGCAISMASTSLMTEVLKGKTVTEAHALFHRFHDLLTGSEDSAGDAAVDTDDFERLMVLAGVREYPMRVKCATLGWHTMEAAIGTEADKVSTE